MRLMMVVSVVVLAVSVSTFAQEKPSVVEISGGYSFERDSRVNDHGFSAEVAGNVSRVLAIVGAGYAYWTNRSFVAQGVDVDANTFFYGVGPRVFSRNASSVTPFATFVASGVVRTRGKSTITRGTQVSHNVETGSNGFAMIMGGGLDFKVTPAVSIRVKPEYARSFESVKGNNAFLFSIGFVSHNPRRRP
jgi:hypothetical protein